jgi:hypothetical protein
MLTLCGTQLRAAADLPLKLSDVLYAVAPASWRHVLAAHQLEPASCHAQVGFTNTSQDEPARHAHHTPESNLQPACKLAASMTEHLHPITYTHGARPNLTNTACSSRTAAAPKYTHNLRKQAAASHKYSAAQLQLSSNHSDSCTRNTPPPYKHICVPTTR